MEEIWHKGQCHCGAVRFEVQAPKSVVVHACNCSLCTMLGYQHLIIPSSKFRLVKGKESLCEYNFNTGAARHYFCSICGVKGFYVPRSNPDGWSVNMRVLDQSTFESIEIEAFDGQNWEENAGRLRHLSVE